MSQAVTLVNERQRRGFTVLVDMGVGIQRDSAIGETAIGLAGLNLGVGGFVNEKLAMVFRLSGTSVNYDAGLFEIRQVSGVGGPLVQYWATNRLILEAGGGLGIWSSSGVSERGLGLILGVSGVLLKRGHHNLVLGSEYAPAFTDPGTVHNIGFTVGYQYHR